MLIRISLVFFMTFCQSSYADIYGCRDSKNKIMISDQPCPAGSVQLSKHKSKSKPLNQDGGSYQTSLETENANIDSNPPKTTTTPNESIKKPIIGRTEFDLIAEKSITPECIDAKRSYEVFAKLANHISEAQLKSKENTMRVACGMREPIVVNTKTETNNTVINSKSQTNVDRSINIR